MRKIFFMKIIFLLTLVAQTLEVGDKIPNYTIKNQFDKPIKFDESIVMIVVSYNKKSTAIFNEMIKNYQNVKPYNFIIDISGAPSGVVTFFIKPVMQNYKHNILMSEDIRFNQRLPYLDEESLVFLELENGIIKEVKFTSSVEQIEALVNYNLLNN